MSDINEIRKKINEIDHDMAKLFEERMELSEEVASFKAKHNLPIEDLNRENEVLKSGSSIINDERIRDYYLIYQKKVMELSKRFQKSLINKENGITTIPTSSYNILIKRGLLSEIEKHINLNRKVMIISDDGVPKDYYLTIKDKCRNSYLYIINHGEQSKSIDSYLLIQKELIKNNFTRNDLIIAVGGGVVGDLSGFIASTYMRGIDYINVPTTLLSMVDSSIGSKCAIDFDSYKNLIGSFYDPKVVVIDPSVLSTLDKRQLSSGIAESIKMAITFDKDLYNLIKNSTDINKDIDDIIYKSILIKKAVVEADKYESNLRSCLNFGHTVGHAIESLNQGKLLHGECVALGMLYFIDPSLKEELIEVLKKYNLPTGTTYDKNELMNYISHDKKNNSNTIKIVYVSEIGKFEFRYLSLKEIEELL